jgi:hypothetical protein
MQLLTKAQKNKMIKNHQDQDGTKDFKAVVKLFNPTGNGTWYLSNIKVSMGLGIERDRWFTPKTFEELQA